MYVKIFNGEVFFWNPHRSIICYISHAVNNTPSYTPRVGY